METLFEIETWINLFNQYQELGILIPFLLAMMESFIPALPLIAIVTINISAHGFLIGFSTSFLGNIIGSLLVFTFFRSIVKHYFIERFYHGKRLYKLLNWVDKQNPFFLFILSCLAFTPSSFINMSFGLSNYKKRQFIISIVLGKFFMILSLSLFGHSLANIRNQPGFVILSTIFLIAIYFLSKYMNEKSEYNKIHHN